MLGGRKNDSDTILAPSSRNRRLCIPGTGSLPANEARPDTDDRQPHRKTVCEIPELFAGSPSRRHTTRRGHLSQVHTPILVNLYLTTKQCDSGLFRVFGGIRSEGAIMRSNLFSFLEVFRHVCGALGETGPALPPVVSNRPGILPRRDGVRDRNFVSGSGRDGSR